MSLYLRIAGSLIALLGVGCALGAFALWHGKPENWPDVLAPDTIVQKTARGLAGIGALLLVSGMATALRIPWGCISGAICTLLFVAGGFWGNYALFGDLRPKHTGANVVLGCVIWLLIWAGYPASG